MEIHENYFCRIFIGPIIHSKKLSFCTFKMPKILVREKQVFKMRGPFLERGGIVLPLKIFWQGHVGPKIKDQQGQKILYDTFDSEEMYQTQKSQKFWPLLTTLAKKMDLKICEPINPRWMVGGDSLMKILPTFLVILVSVRPSVLKIFWQRLDENYDPF